MRHGIRYSSRQEKERKYSKGFFWVVMLPVLFFLVIWSIIGPFGIWKLIKIKNRRDQLIVENMNKIRANADIEKDIKRLKTDPSYQEKIIRKELGMIRNGEIVYEFRDKKKDNK
ncbi:MAG: FtsB family cell division protein [Dissulfurimicrobium sp.]|uniref:FtsB family cell division protein n=1 Tax=Dissulfurimicrobium sp. TaxID=2022436 RepID=UPI004049E2C6